MSAETTCQNAAVQKYALKQAGAGLATFFQNAFLVSSHFEKIVIPPKLNSATYAQCNSLTALHPSLILTAR